MGDSGWSAVDAGSPLRTYQRRAVSEVLDALDAPGSRVCLVAPPGAGKTRCALHVAAALATPLEVRVPTSALRLQWQERADEEIVALDDGGSRPPIRVHTYAGHDGFAEHALVVLDEAHHLGSAWGAHVQQALGPSHRVLGLTATPPLGSPGWDRFVDLVGEPPVEVEAPPLVRDRHLSPFLDLVWPVLTDIDDVPALRDAHHALDAVEEQLGEELKLWMATRLREDLWELTEQRFARQQGLLVALCRMRHALGRDLPADLPSDPELQERPTLHDRVTALWAFGPDRDEVRAAIRDAGFRPAGRGFAMRDDVAYQSLSASRARVRGLRDVLALEARHRTDWLRALVLTDRDVEGTRLSAREVLRALCTDERTDELDPMLVTGKALWVDDDLWPRIAGEVPDLPHRLVQDHHEVDVSAWPVAERVALVTRLLTSGVTRCLVGTHHLLGEGWDCPAVNCVVDLTGIAAPVTVNQVRGRALRSDPADPAKVASLWEVLPLAPGVDGGGRALDKLVQRHAHTLGIDERGRIRAGVTRIDPQLTSPLSEVAAAVPAIRTRMTDRVAQMKETAAMWAVGQDYADRRLWQVEGEQPRRPRRKSTPGKPVPAGPRCLQARRRRRGWAAVATAASGLLAGGLSVGVAPLMGSTFALAGVLATGGALAAGGLLVAAGLGASSLRRGDPRPASMAALAGALREVGEVEGGLHRDGDRWWLEGDPDHSRVFAEAAAELLGPIRYPRYLLVEMAGQVWPVPTALGAERTRADVFATHWARRMGTCEVIYARQGRGRELLASCWREPPPPEVDTVELWI